MNHTRHMAIFNVKDLSVSLIGAGGIGATTALTLAKMGVGELIIFDDDIVSEENLATQLHQLDHLGESKVAALMETLSQFGDDTDMYGSKGRVGSSTDLYGDIIISAVDSINARKEIWWAALNSNARWYIEMRMAAEELQVHVVDMRNTGWYNEYINSQNEEDVPELPCTAKSTFFTGMIAGGIAGSIVKELHTNGGVPYRKLIYNISRQEMMKL